MKGKEGIRRERESKREGGGSGRGGRVVKGEGGIELHIYPGAPSS